MSDPYSTTEQLHSLTEPHPVYQKIIDRNAEGKYPLGQVDWSDPKVIAYLNKLRSDTLDATYGTAPSGVQESPHTVKMRDGFESLIIVHSPAEPPVGGSALIQLNFGGGFVMGEARQLGGYARALVQLYGAVVATITYRLGPEHKFPAGHNDAWDSFIWLGEHAKELGADPEQCGFIVGGVSAGANLSAVIAQNAVEHGAVPAVTGLWLCVPRIFPTVEHVPSEYRHLFIAETTPSIVDGPILSKKTIQGFGLHYKPDPDSPWYSPVNSAKPFIGLPSSYIEVNGLDPLRDDGLIYEKIVRKNGTPTKLTVWSGLPYAHFATMQEPEAMPLRRAAARDTMRGFAWLLKKEEPADEAIDTSVVLPQSG